MADSELDQLIRQAEILQQQAKLEVQFQKNMILFEKYAPVICRNYRNYQPTTVRLNLDERGYLNLVNINTGNPVYNKDPREFCHDQVAHYTRKPNRFNIKYNDLPGRYFFQFALLQKLLDHVKRPSRKAPPSIKKPIGLFIINGCGLGYHIPEIIESMDIYTLCICDPNKDSFYASLHTIDWEPIINYCYRKGRLLKLYIGSKEEATITSLRLLVSRIGLQNMSNTFFYPHLSSDINDSFSSKLKKQFHLTLTGTGFLEDEQISLTHTVENLRNNTPVLGSQTPPSSSLPPAFIVGNGPSLDGLIDTLKEQRKGAVIFSCGTTIGTLCQLGITPDFHVEMERTETTDYLLRGTTKEFRKKINILALNTVEPRSLSLFKNAYIAKKANDPGSFLIDSEIKERLPVLNLCNPTCTNAGLAFAVRMGFKEIYLLGVDLGMKNESEHHAKASLYYSKDESKRAAPPAENFIAPMTVKGNFGGDIKTTAVLDTSRANIELLFSYNKDVKAYNLGQGAYIEGAEPMEADKLNLSAFDNRSGLLDTLTSTCFTAAPLNQPLTADYLTKKHLLKFNNIINEIQLPETIDNLSNLQQHMDTIHLTIWNLKQSDPILYLLMAGSVQTFFTLIMKGCLDTISTEELNETYAHTSGIYKDFIERSSDLINNDLLKTHDMSTVHA